MTAVLTLFAIFVAGTLWFGGLREPSAIGGAVLCGFTLLSISWLASAQLRHLRKDTAFNSPSVDLYVILIVVVAITLGGLGVLGYRVFNPEHGHVAGVAILAGFGIFASSVLIAEMRTFTDAEC